MASAHGLPATVRFWPRVCKNALTSSPWIIDLRWLSDRTVNAAGRIGQTWNTSTLFLQPLRWAKISLFQAVSVFIKL